MKLALWPLLFLAAQVEAPDSFVPKHRVAGIGAGRQSLTAEQMAGRTEAMIQAQTFAIMREPQAVAGASRITSHSGLRSIFQAAAKKSGFPVATLEAMAYLESWGDPKAESPAGPKGIMQISEATARRIGLQIVRARKYKVTYERVVTGRKGKKAIYQTVKRKIPYTVTVRDDRLQPSRAVPAAAVYLASMEKRFGGRDWAIFAYHCGEGCVAEMLDLTRQAKGPETGQPTVARMFFAADPVRNRALYEAVWRHMERDFSPTYWFRVRRAEELLALYRGDRPAFVKLAEEHKSQFGNAPRAPHRLSVWIRRNHLTYRNSDDLRIAHGAGLVPAMDRPAYFGYAVSAAVGAGDAVNQAYYRQASPAALGALAYIAYETRRLHASYKGHTERFQPIEVTSLVQPLDRVNADSAPGEVLMHSSGQVFDIRFSTLPPGELECLRFVLNDLGWQGYVGFVEEGNGTLHVGPAPAAREFFTRIYQETLGANGAASE